MKFPKNSRELRRIFIDASAPDIARLEGEYLVDMLTIWPSFRRFSHKKVIYRENDLVKGHNVLFSKVWGRFIVEEGACSDIGSVKAAVINYNRDDNSFPVRGIRDYIRCVSNELYIGRFYYCIAGSPRFLGYFSLEKASPSLAKRG